MTKKIKDLCVSAGKYTQNGKEKNRYVNVGSRFQSDDGGEFDVIHRYINFAGFLNPHNKEGIIISAFDPKEDNKEAQQQTAQPQSNALDDDLTF